MWIVICAEVYFLVIYHDKDLPGLPVSGDSSELRPSVPATEFTMVNFWSTH